MGMGKTLESCEQQLLYIVIHLYRSTWLIYSWSNLTLNLLEPLRGMRLGVRLAVCPVISASTLVNVENV